VTAITTYSKIFDALFEEVAKYAGDTPFGSLVASVTFLGLFGATYLAAVGLEYMSEEKLTY
jgi:hypothetical protein